MTTWADYYPRSFCPQMNLTANMGLAFNLSEQTSQLEARKRVNGPNLSLSNQSSGRGGGVYGITRVRLASSARRLREGGSATPLWQAIARWSSFPP